MAEHRTISEHAAEQDQEPELCHRAIDMVQRRSLQNEMGGEHEERDEDGKNTPSTQYMIAFLR